MDAVPRSSEPSPDLAPELSPMEFSSAVTAITSAFGDPTRREIFLFARETSNGVTASEVAEQFGLHPNVARHHLDKLSAGGYLEVAVDKAEHAGAGRPSKRYRGTGQQVQLAMPVRRDDVLLALLGRALGRLPVEEAEELAEEVGVEYGQAMAKAMGDGAEGTRSFRSALHAVADALTAHGFAAHAETQGNQLRIVSENCPFGGPDVVHPVVCAVDRGMVKGMLKALYGDTSPATEASRPKGDDRCVTAVQA